MSIGVIARLKIQEGKNADFEATFLELQAAVSSSEPGNNFYSLHQSREDSNVYIVLEQYKDQASLDAHGKSDHFRSIGGKLGPFMAGAPEIEYLDGIG